jgi:putative phosphoesterase
MRIAVVTDIHGNLTALDAVIEDLQKVAPDLVVHGGDLVAAGHRPVEVLDRVRERGWPGVQGNTDEMLWKPELFEEFMRTTPKLRHVWTMVFQQQAPVTRELLGPERIGWLRQMPLEWRGEDLAVVHAAPGNLWRSPMADATDEELATTYGPLDRAVVAYGHIHLPFVRDVGRAGRRCLVANCGSVGMPFDGDSRASYLVVDDGVPAIRRVEYDIEREVRSLRQSGYPDAVRLEQTLLTARYVLPAPTSELED